MRGEIFGESCWNARCRRGSLMPLRFRLLAFTLAACAVTTVTTVARADDPPPRPHDEGEVAATYRREDNTKILGGGLLFAGTYGGSVGLALWARKENADASALYIPVVGPIVEIVTMERSIQHSSTQDRVRYGFQRLGSLIAYPLLAIDAIGQAGGLGLFVAGLVGSSTSAQPKKSVAAAGANRPHVTPYTTGTTFGLSGSF